MTPPAGERPAEDLRAASVALSSPLPPAVHDWESYKRTCDPDHRMADPGDLALFLGGSHDSFTGQLLALFAKARSTPDRFHRLTAAFPREAAAWLAWQQVSDRVLTASELCVLLVARDEQRRVLIDAAPGAADTMRRHGPAAAGAANIRWQNEWALPRHASGCDARAQLDDGTILQCVVGLPEHQGAHFHPLCGFWVIELGVGPVLIGMSNHPRGFHIHPSKPGGGRATEEALAWVRANGIDPRQVLLSPGLRVDLTARTITHTEVVEPGTPGATQASRYAPWTLKKTVPLLVDPPAELLRVPHGFPFYTEIRQYDPLLTDGGDE